MIVLLWILGILATIGFIWLIYKIGILAVIGEIIEGIIDALSDIDFD